MQQTTVTVQGFAWCPKTRTHSDKVIHEATNRVTAQAYIQRNKRILKDLMVVRNNDRHMLDALIAAVDTFGQVPETEVA
jgi:hypothetical protein|tara:strand:+ start:480 stop:716 length:237 start_codon:yes stop_codon:yes gene_type:complete